MANEEISHLLVSFSVSSRKGKEPTNTLKQGRLHHQRRLHNLPTLRLKGPIPRHGRELPRLEILPRTWQVRNADAGREAFLRTRRKVGVG